MSGAAIDLMLRDAADHYQAGRPEPAGALCAGILCTHPGHLPALHLAAVIAIAGDRLAEGAELLGQVFALDPDHGPALVTLGDTLADKGDHDGAAAAFRRALVRRPMDVGLHVKLGAALMQSARFAEAIPVYQRARELDPEQLRIHFDLAVALAGDGRDAEAEDVYSHVAARDAAYHSTWLAFRRRLDQRRSDDIIVPYCRAVAANPTDPAAHGALGMALHRNGRLAEAIVHFGAAVDLAPQDAPSLRLLGRALQEAGRTEEAIAIYRRFTALDATDFETYNNLGACLCDLGRLDEAAEACAQALAVKPDFAKAHINLGVMFERRNDGEAAVAAYRRAIACDPDEAGGHANLAVALHNRGELDEALVASRRAAALAPGHPVIQSNLAGVLFNKGAIDEALAVSERAVALAPDNALVRFNHSHLLLICGDLKRGFADYRRRRECFAQLQMVRGPEWQGESFAGRTLLLFSEQGLGDVLHFIRYLPMVIAKGGTIVLQVQPALSPLLSSLQGVTVVPTGRPLPPLDLQLPLMDLPYLFGTTLDTIPADVPYLHADPTRVATWRRALGSVTALKVGVAWAGSPTHKGDRYRSLPAAAVLPRLVMPGVQLYSLQKEPRPADVPVLTELGPDVIDLGPSLGDFADTAAVIAALDLVISVDTSIVHLAGALGALTWVLLPYAQDWRWLRDRADSPWYPSLRLFRQNEPQAWDGVLTRVAAALKRLTQARAA